MRLNLAAAALAAAFALTGCTANADTGADYRGPSLGCDLAAGCTASGSFRAQPGTAADYDGTVGDRLTVGDTAPSLGCDLAAGCTASGSLGMARHPDSDPEYDGTLGHRVTVGDGER